MTKPKRNHEVLYAAARIERSQQRKKRVKTGATIDDALLCAIGNERDGSGIPVPPLLSIIAGYLKPFVRNMHRIPFESKFEFEKGRDFIVHRSRQNGMDTLHFKSFRPDVILAGSIGAMRAAYSVFESHSIICPYAKVENCSALIIERHGLNPGRACMSMTVTSDGKTMWTATPKFRSLYRWNFLTHTGFSSVESAPVRTVQLIWYCAPNIKPDSELLIVTVSGQLRRYDIASNKMHTLIESGVRSAACAETGHIFIASDSDQTVRVFDPTTGQLTSLFVCAAPLRAVVLMEESRRLVGVAENEVWLVDVSPEFFVLRSCCDRDR